MRPRIRIKDNIGCRGVEGFAMKQQGEGTSVGLMGVLMATGLHGMGQRSRHSGWVTARQFWQRRYTLPNFVLLPHDTQNSDLITLERK